MSSKKENLICYTGYGAKTDGTHTEKEFTSVMDKNFKKDCMNYMQLPKCPICKKSRKLTSKFIKKMIKKNFVMDEKMKLEEKKSKEFSQKCSACKNKRTKKCNTKEYIKFSGASNKKCAKKSITEKIMSAL